MFKTIADSMVSNDKSFYFNEKLPFQLREFACLKYLIDPEHEQFVLSECIYNLFAYAICTHGMYAETLWMNAYGVSPLKIKPMEGYSFRSYADQTEGLIEAFSYSGNGTYELVRLIICYTIQKGYNIENILKMSENNHPFCKNRL